MKIDLHSHSTYSDGLLQPEALTLRVSWSSAAMHATCMACSRFGLYARYAKRYGLLASAGSDFHGPGESRRDFGDLPELPSGCIPIWSSW